jgi:hypothetical protein
MLFYGWVRLAPPSYKDDGFLNHRTPIIITSRYGQNQELGSDEEDGAVDAENWEVDRDYGLIRYISVAIATHIR